MLGWEKGKWVTCMETGLADGTWWVGLVTQSWSYHLFAYVSVSSAGNGADKTPVVNLSSVLPLSVESENDSFL